MEISPLMTAVPSPLLLVTPPSVNMGLNQGLEEANFVSVPVAPTGPSAEFQGCSQMTEILSFACPIMSKEGTENMNTVPDPPLTNLSLPSQLNLSILVPHGADSQENPSITTSDVRPPIAYASTQETPVMESQGIPLQRLRYSPITHQKSPTPQPSSGGNEPNGSGTPGSLEPQTWEGTQPLPRSEINPSVSDHL